jgi:hypothetical protein
VRRLDENTAPENFLHDLFGMEPDSDAWRRQRDCFLAAFWIPAFAGMTRGGRNWRCIYAMDI